jgi:hypothetical protein
MKSLHWQLAFCVVVLLSAGVARAQLASDTEKVEPPPAGVDKYYWDLSKSDDRVLRSMVERYAGLVKIREWSDLSGKSKIIAHYVKHDPQLTTVTLRIMRGKGAERTSDDKTVPVEKLSKECQSRVKQIDIAQKKMKEMAAKLAKDGNTTVPALASENPGAPMADERGAEPGAAGPGPGPGGPAPSAAPAAPEPDPSALEPDPLGFAEVQITSPSGPGPGEIPPGVQPPAPSEK